jgi:hypothetical protein
MGYGVPSLAEKRLRNGEAWRLGLDRADVEYDAPPSGARVLKPQQKGDRFFHIVVVTTRFKETFAQCISCRRGIRLSNFWLAENPGALATTKNFVLDARCNRCRQQELETSLSALQGYTPELDLYWTKNFSSLCAGARARNIEISITKDTLIERYLRNECKCEVTGILLKPKAGRNNRIAPSVDRIDSSGHYSRGNIQIVARAVNLMKGDMETEEFYEWCKRICERKK